MSKINHLGEGSDKGADEPNVKDKNLSIHNRDGGFLQPHPFAHFYVVASWVTRDSRTLEIIVADRFIGAGGTDTAEISHVRNTVI